MGREEEDESELFEEDWFGDRVEDHGWILELYKVYLLMFIIEIELKI